VGLRRYRRHAIFGAFVLAAIITPTQDPFTMLVMALPLVVFFECNIIFARMVERRRAVAA
jgi:sec-independent protein translocase protein TatC